MTMMTKVNKVPLLLLAGQTLVLVLTGIGIQDTEAQQNITYTTYTDEDLSFEYPEGWIVEEKENRFERGPDIMISSPESETYQELRVVKSQILLPSLKATAEGILEVSLDSYRYNIEYDASVIEDIALDKLKVDNETAATFLLAIYDSETGDPLRVIESVSTRDGNNEYGFTYTSFASTFDSPENTAVREHFFNSIKWVD